MKGAASTLLVLSLIGKSEQQPQYPTSSANYPEDTSYEAQRHSSYHKKHGHKNHDVGTSVFYADANTAYDVRHKMVGRVYDSRDEHVCMRGCDDVNHCFDAHTGECRLPSCKVPAPPPAPLALQTTGTSQHYRQLRSQSYPYGMAQAAIIKKKHHHKSNRAEDDRDKKRVHDDDDGKLPDDDSRHSTQGAAYEPISKEYAAELAVDKQNYDTCNGQNHGALVNTGQSYEYQAWDFDSLATPSYGSVQESVANSYSRALETMKDDYHAPMSRTHGFDGRALSEEIGDCHCKCPAETINIRCLRIHRAGWFAQLFTAIILFLPFIPVVYSGFRHPRWMSAQTWLNMIGTLKAQGNTKSAQNLLENGPFDENMYIRREALLSLAAACFFQAFAFLTMVMGPGSTINCHDARQIFWGRSFGWLFSQSCVIYALITLDGKDFSTRVGWVLTVITMNLSTLVSMSARNAAHWIYFIFRMAAMVKIICQLFCLVGQQSRSVISGWEKSQLTPLVSRFAFCILLGWGGEALIWMFAEGSNWLCVDWAEFLYCLCDLLSCAIPAVMVLTFRPAQSQFLPVADSGSSLI